MMTTEDKAIMQSNDVKTMRRLNRHRPDLAERVRAGELSLNAAAVEAAFRRRTLQIADTDPVRVAERIRAKFGQTFADALAHAIKEQLKR